MGKTIIELRTKKIKKRDKKMAIIEILDQEDRNFLEDLIEELPKIDNGLYISEAVELENILYRILSMQDLGLIVKEED